MTVVQRDPAATATTLMKWLTEVAGLDGVEIGDITIPDGTGWSNETVLFDAAWQEGGGREQHHLVARIAPTEYTVFPGSTFTTQFEIMQAVDAHGGVPMPKIHWLERSTAWFDSPFWIMDRVDGDIPADQPPYAGSGWLQEASVDDQARAWWSGIEAMATIHRIDLDSLGLTETTVERSDDTIGAQLDHYERFLHWAEDGTPHELARRALATLRADKPPEPALGPTLTWGDARLSNLIYQDFAVAAVLDWEMSSVADPLLDLGWWIFADDALTLGSGCQRLPGFADRLTTAARWSELTGRSTDALDYYELVAALRFTVIMLRMGKLLHDIGLVPEGFGYDNLISQALAQRL